MNASSYLKVSLKIISNFLILFGSGIFVFTYGPITYSEIIFFLNTPDESVEVVINNPSREEYLPNTEELDDSSGIENNINAVNDSFSIVIPKIDVNAPVIEDVSMANYDQYMEALKLGVAHAQGTSLPGEAGNMFLFAHSSLNFWQLGPYATVFNLLNKLKEGDLVFVVKNGKTYMYKVKSMEIVAGWDTTPFDTEYEESVLTMITCYPPGATINRYVVVATYVGMQDYY